MKVIIAEKSSMAEKYRKALRNEPGISVVASSGHIEELADLAYYIKPLYPEKEKVSWYDMARKLPMLPQEFHYEVSNKTIFANIAEKIQHADEIILACDPDREGELIHRNILTLLQQKNIVKAASVSRVWLHSETEKEIQKAFAARRPFAEFEGYYRAARYRQLIDWLIGIQLTVLYTTKFSSEGVISIGRVQTWLLAEIIKRYKDFTAFTSRPYWFIQFLYKGIPFKHVTNDLEPIRYYDQLQADAVFAKVRPLPLTVRSVETKPFTEYAPSLFDLKGLQKHMAKTASMAPEETLEVAQRLYETHELISYPRTDCDVLSEAEANEIGNAVALVKRTGAFTDEAALVDAVNPTYILNKKYIGKLKGHYAIIPVLTRGNEPIPALNEKEAKVFRAIVYRLMGALLPPAEGTNTVILGAAAEELFQGKIKSYIKQGYRELYRKDAEALKAEDEEFLSDDPLAIAEGDALQGEFILKDDVTKPEPLFTDVTIIGLMENAHRLVQDEQLKKALKDAEGIGTAATRSTFIPLLIRREYIIKDKKAYKPTEKGLALFDHLPEELMTADFSAKLEYDIYPERVLQTEEQRLLSDTQEFLVRVFGKIAGVNHKFVTGGTVIGKCPVCGSDIVEQRFTYACKKYGCIAIQKEMSHAKLSPKDIAAILRGQVTEKLKMHSDKKNKDFEARLKLDGTKVVYVFD